MENKQSTLQVLSSQLQQTYHRFFDIEEPTIKHTSTVATAMPSSQIKQFIQQALDKHYQIELTLAGIEQADYTVLTGAFIKQISKERYLFKVKKDNVYRIVELVDVHYLTKL